MTAERSQADHPRGDEVGSHVYAVVRADHRGGLAELRGLDGTPLRLVTHGELGAVVNDVTIDRPPGRRAELVAYYEVLNELVRGGPVVPVAFGSVLVDDESVVNDLLATDAEHFAALLDEVEGRCQYNLRATYHEGVVLTEIVAVDHEVAALRERTRDQSEEQSYADRVRLGELVARALEEKREADADALLDVTTVHAVAYRSALGADVDDLAEFSFLVDDERREDFEEQLEQLADAVSERIRLRLVGPVAPFDFVGGR